MALIACHVGRHVPSSSAYDARAPRRSFTAPQANPPTWPASTPSPGAASRAMTAPMRSARPATYPPPGASVPPGFLMSEPIARSAPTSQGSRTSVNSP
eukprot:364707-Chlamydomonas_euryale.AAC.23